MKRPFYTLLMLATFICGAATAAEPSGAIRLFEGASNDSAGSYWEAPAEEIKKWPLWKLGDEPPISVRVAIAIAVKAVEDSAKYQLDSVHIQRPITADSRFDPRRAFFFIVQFKKPDAAMGKAYHFVVMVNMAGQIIPMKNAALKK